MAVAVVFLLVQIAAAFSALPQIQKCRLQDSDCMKKSAQPVVPVLSAGIQEVGSPILDPMHVDTINVDLAGLKLHLRDLEITGLSNSIIDKLSVDMDKKQMQVVFHGNWVMKGKYKASGRLLILPISGDGDSVVKLKNCQISINMVFDISKNKDGKDFIEMKSYKYTYDVKDNAHFYLGNLFNGKKAASDAMHLFMNTSWKLLTEEFGIPMFNQPVEKLYNSIKAYLKSQPLEDIAIV